MLVKHPVKLSVIIPVYNAESFLHSTLDSIIKQSFKEFEIICVNDGSTDQSLQILEQYASKDSRIIVYSKLNSGGIPAATVNYGIDRSQGEYVFRVDADDYLSSNLLQKMYNRAKETDADSVLPDLLFISDEGMVVKSIIGLRGNKAVVLTNRQAASYSLNWTIHGCALWRGSMIRKLRLEEFGMNSDEYSTRVLLFNSNKVVFCEGSYFYRQHAQGITKKISSRSFDQFYTAYRLLIFFEQNKFDEPTLARLQVFSYKTILSVSKLLTEKGKELNMIERANAEKRISSAYQLINKKTIRQYLFCENGAQKYVWIMLTTLNWSLLTKILLIPFPSRIKKAFFH